MSLLDTASLILTPNGYKADKLYSVKPTDASGDMTVVRATTATRVDSAGLIESVDINVPRLDYTNASCPSILVEPERRNLFLYSEQFNTVSWVKSGLGTGSAPVVTPNVETAPDGTLTADLIVFDRGAGNTSSDRSDINQAPLVVAATTYSSSFYLKAATSNDVGKQIAIRGVDQGSFITITLTSQWVRYNRTSAASSTVGLVNLQNRGGVTNANIVSLHAWGGQLEAGSNATSYIPTVAAAVTRNADVISKTGISSLIGQTEGTLYAEVNLDNFEVNNVRIFAISDGTSANRIMLLTNSSNRITTIVSNSSVEQAQISSGTLTKGLYKIAVAYALNDFAFYINGALIGVDSSINVPICTDVYLGKIESSSPTAILNDRIELATLFKTRLTNAQLATLTTL